MKKNPVLPYAIIAVIGILAIIILSFVGVNQREAIQLAEEGGAPVEEGEVSTNPEEIYANNCAACHGADLSGGMGPELATVGSNFSADEVVEIIQQGTGSMPPQSQVAVEEANLLAEWLIENQ